MASELRDDLVTENLVTEPVRIIVRQQFLAIIEGLRSRMPGKTRTPGQAKDLPGVFNLIRRVILDYERREETPEKYKLIFTEESPDFTADTETITCSVVKGLPGAFGEGRPFEADVRNLVPTLREEADDPENPGYKIATLGYWYDNIIRLTCFARTNKRANMRVNWLLEAMQEYMWYFRAQGVNRILFQQRGSDFVTEENGIKLYGRPLEYFVRTESIRLLREKKLESLEVDTGIMSDGSTLVDELRE